MYTYFSRKNSLTFFNNHVIELKTVKVEKLLLELSGFHMKIN